jgi:hypothetical protein
MKDSSKTYCIESVHSLDCRLVVTSGDNRHAIVGKINYDWMVVSMPKLVILSVA